jgi:hypothetical protein
MIVEAMIAVINDALQFYPKRADPVMLEVKRLVKLHIEDFLRGSAEDSSSEDTPT